MRRICLFIREAAEPCLEQLAVRRGTFDPATLWQQFGKQVRCRLLVHLAPARSVCQAGGKRTTALINRLGWTNPKNNGLVPCKRSDAIPLPNCDGFMHTRLVGAKCPVTGSRGWVGA